MNISANITEALAHWLCAQRWHDLPPLVQQKALDVVYDSVGAMIGCSRLPEVEALVRLQRRMGGEAHCTMIGHAGLTSVINAAMVNGGMAHGNESDPVHLKSVGGHVAAGPVPTALTVGQWLNASGQDVLRAVALGAKGTYIGRAMAYGLGAMGEAGVTKALQCIHKELDISMAFCGRTNIKTVDKGILLDGTYPTA